MRFGDRYFGVAKKIPVYLDSVNVPHEQEIIIAM